MDQDGKKVKGTANLVKNQAIYSLHSISSGLEYPGISWSHGFNDLSCRSASPGVEHIKTTVLSMNDFLSLFYLNEILSKLFRAA